MSPIKPGVLIVPPSTPVRTAAGPKVVDGAATVAAVAPLRQPVSTVTSDLDTKVDTTTTKRIHVGKDLLEPTGLNDFNNIKKHDQSCIY